MQTYKLKIPEITAGRAQNTLTRTPWLIIGMNTYQPGRKISLHRHIGQDHTLLVLDGQATFYDEEGNSAICNRGEGLLIPDNYLYRFDSTGKDMLVMLRIEAKKGDKPKSLRVAADGHTRDDEEGLDKFFVLDGEVVEGKFWEL